MDRGSDDRIYHGHRPQRRTRRRRHPLRGPAPEGTVRWVMPIQLGDGRVLHPGRWRWLRALAWLVLLFFLTAAAFGLPLQAAVDRLPSGNGAAGLAGRLIACTAALGCYALAVRLGEGREPSELALRPALPGLVGGAVLGLTMMTALMGLLAVTGLYDITLTGGAAPPWNGIGLALQAAVTEELWMRALLFRLLWRALGPVPAFTIAASVFGALHLANPGASPLAGAGVVAAGMMFCVLYTVSGRLWVPIGVHLSLEPRPGLPVRRDGLRRRPRQLDRLEHSPPGRVRVADRRPLRPRGVSVRPDHDQRRHRRRAHSGSPPADPHTSRWQRRHAGSRPCPRVR